MVEYEYEYEYRYVFKFKSSTNINQFYKIGIILSATFLPYTPEPPLYYLNFPKVFFPHQDFLYLFKESYTDQQSQSL